MTQLPTMISSGHMHNLTQTQNSNSLARAEKGTQTADS